MIKTSSSKIVGYFLTALFISIFIYMIDWKVSFKILFAVNLQSIAIYFVLISTSLIIRCCKYKIIFGNEYKWIETGYIYFMSKAGGSITPGTLGAFSPLIYKEYRKKKIGFAIIADKILEFYFLILIGFIGMVILQNMSPPLIILSGLCLLIMTCFIFLLRNNSLWKYILTVITNFDNNTSGQLSSSIQKKFKLLISTIEKTSFEITKLGKKYLYLFLLTFLAYLLSIAAIKILFLAFSIDIGLYLLLEVIALSGLIMVISLIPAGIGITEISILIILENYGINRNAFASYALAARFLNLSFLFIYYFVFYLLFEIFIKRKAENL